MAVIGNWAHGYGVTGQISNETVLVLRALGLGDVVSGIAALRGVRRAWPTSRLVLAAPASLGSWLRSLGLVDDIVPTRGLGASLSWPEDATGHIAVNLHGCGPESHRLLQATRPSRLVAYRCLQAGHGGGPLWSEHEHEVQRWCRLVTAQGGPCEPDDLRLPRLTSLHGSVVVHPGARYAARRWPLERWCSVVDELARRGYDVVVTGDRAERPDCARVAGVHPWVRNLSGRLSVPALADLIAGAWLLLCTDTGPAHLATAYRTPSVLLFGPVSPALWGPSIDHELHLVLWRGDAAAERGNPHGATVDPALAAIGESEVLHAAETMLAATEATRCAKAGAPRS